MGFYHSYYLNGIVFLILIFISFSSHAEECRFGNCINGYGHYKLDQGDFYIGDFKNSKPHGYGVFVRSNANSRSGKWKEGVLIRDMKVVSRYFDDDSVDSALFISEIQKRLKTLGLFPAEIDGIYGASTQKALADYQSQYDLKSIGHAVYRILSLRDLLADPDPFG